MKRWPTKWLPPPKVTAAAILSGALLACAFPPFSLGPVGFVALIPLLAALYTGTYSRRTYFQSGYAFGVSFFLLNLWWIVKLLPESSITFPWLMFPALLVLVLYLALYPGLSFWLVRVVAGQSRIVSLAAGPTVWLLFERLRSSTELGFPWGIIGYALSRQPTLIQAAAYVGVFGVGSLIVLVNFAWAQSLISRARRTRAAYFAVGALVFGGLALGGLARLGDMDHETDGEPTRVAVVQPNIDLRIKWKEEYKDSTFRVIDRLTRHAARVGASLVVFPETSAPVYIHHSPEEHKFLTSLARELGVGLYIGFLDGRYDGPERSLNIYNSSGLFRSDGRMEQYDKRHLLPFGEAIPFAWKFRRFRDLNLGQANFQPGSRTEPIRSITGSLGPLICFESIFPELSRRYVDSGTDLLINITNDGWFGATPGPYQHADMAIYRAVENGRYLLRSANTGISMIVDPGGRVVGSLGLFTEGVLVQNIRVRRQTTVYTRWGDRPIVIISLLVLVAAAVFTRLRPRNTS